VKEEEFDIEKVQKEITQIEKQIYFENLVETHPITDYDGNTIDTTSKTLYHLEPAK